ncbi:MAG: hypothetical protein KDJ52_24305 [Anaerolineae bacterium]|nr:hypothetical protein [Anaerolineae bacterium]
MLSRPTRPTPIERVVHGLDLAGSDFGDRTAFLSAAATDSDSSQPG